MHTYSQAFYALKEELTPMYDEREASAIAHEVMLHVTGLDKLERLVHKDKELTGEQQTLFTQACIDLLTGKPLQYVTGSAWFMNREFIVNEHVLIPRPETEELVQWIIDDNKKENLTIFDIGTGSGCIPISLKLALPAAIVTTCDISEMALETAAANAKKLMANIHFIGMDILDTEQQNNTGVYDVIVSNPPYIPVAEKANMHSNVKDHEPEIALFVPNDDALLFYRAIAQFGKTHLAEKGFIYCELESSHAQETKALFELMGYSNVEMRKDMHGNWRMLKAQE
ncbi:peptide chain release factor N(5)-glutamine methyltransferase [Flavipsychrobacter stenotrophus]|uniref:peptide chain release factor N(5)-glutamine methyltransferase n=1 Tax=Flavipsychrobacter stenotrophus TaxID=2077091 RepID=A0A2S7SWT9_9BACT|nr:peptide chain release factor N(5)-glutamine methyltransferase [Flavipsychrobacter stenotrophus]PQJ11055.1 peptide chain release factor N(5)-glutamine methyltransferase [Flavipsychrobacter stenotrophus]